MDPISIATIIGTATKIVDSCVCAGYNLEQIRNRWKKAPAMLNSIGNECRTIGTTIKNIKKRLERHTSGSNADENFLNELSSALEHCSTTLQNLESTTAAICPDGKKKLRKWQHIKISFNDSNLKDCLYELRWQAQAATNLLSSFNHIPEERRQLAKQVNLSHTIHKSQTSVASSSPGSILDVDLVYDEEDNLVPVQSSRSALIWLWVPSMILVAACVLAIFSGAIGLNMQTTTISPHILGASRSTETTKPRPNLTEDSVYKTPEEDLFTAAAAGSLQDVKNLLKLGGKPYIRGNKNWTPLHYAAANGREEIMRLLLKYKDTNWRADDDMTPLHLAARYGHTVAVKEILKISGHAWNRERAVDPLAIEQIKRATGNKFDKQFENFFRRKTFTARELAVIYGHTDTALAFHIESGGDILHALSCACMLGDVGMVEMIRNHLKNRWNYQKPGSEDSQVPWFPAPPLHLVVMSGNRATVALFLAPGVQAKDQSRNYMSGFFSDAYPPYSAPAHYAAVVGSTEILVALERRGADLAALDHLSRTPLSYAVEKLNEAAVELLVEKHPKRSAWLFGSSVSNTYLGSGHVWLNKKQKAAAIPNQRIVTALKDVGFPVKDR